ncbi:MAG TPA: beta-galactosidase [Acidobacteriaceae bacterium]|nr:beta-galactosidase [Acidobacteriaceae bacterium]
MRAASIFMGILFTSLGVACDAQSRLHIDARSFTPPVPSSFVGGASESPSGGVLGLNSRYLTIDGKPWLPVMGEFHYTRVPRAEWEEEILKAKASGVNIFAAYVIWIHHEEIESQFDWSGDRDLRAFVELCKKHHMYVYMRIGPWAHGEVRNGGFPDWLLKKAPLTRRDDPTYLRYVAAFYRQIGEQLRGELWKDGGPVIGVQLENEYSSKGPGMGDEYILTLKNMAIKAGIDVPYYSVTGWDGAVVPKGQTIAVFGGYPDQPWDGSIKDLPPQEVYAFRFGSRVTGTMGMLGSHVNPGSSENYDYPFITAEMGGGVEDTYHRRPVISPDDVAAMVPVMLGSGVNLYGYYMYQGSQSPQGYLISLQQSLCGR